MVYACGAYKRAWMHTHIHGCIHLCHMQRPEEEVFFFIPDLIPLRLDLSLNLEIGPASFSDSWSPAPSAGNTLDHARLSSFSHGCRDLSSGSCACARSTLVHWASFITLASVFYCIPCTKIKHHFLKVLVNCLHQTSQCTSWESSSHWTELTIAHLFVTFICTPLFA